jgi:hypothetical protein
MTQGAETSGVWTENVRIHSHDVDFNQRATLEAICHDFLEAAWEHAEVLGWVTVSWPHNKNFGCCRAC